MKKQSPDKLVIGLTGGVGTGKTTAARMFKQAGADVIDADRIVHGFLARGSTAYREIVKVFGAEILLQNGEINRRDLGKLVFKDRRLRKKLERILHPRVKRRINELIKLSRKKLVIVDAPLLYEAGMERSMDKVVVVVASSDTQMRRCRSRKGFSKEEIISRIASQLPLKDKIRSADFVIDNNGTRTHTHAQVELIRRSLWRS
jgi:dephospho-CoA kinase